MVNLSDAATDFVEALKINSISEEVRRGRLVVVKRRNVYGERGADLINFYFRLANISIRYVSDVPEWRRREMNSFLMLNGARFRAYSPDKRTVCEDKLPGRSLWDHMKARTLTRRMVEAAGREYRRAHKFPSDRLSKAWSHADASMPNVIYDEQAKRARLIDFEITHEKSLPPIARHADDLRVFLFDMLENVTSRQWLFFAIPFLKAYGDGAVIAELETQLVIPNGLALIWWNVRTNFADTTKVKRRLGQLRSAIRKLELYRLASRKRERQRRRPSTICNVTSAGTPTAKSRILVIKEMAKALSPGMPRRLPTRR
jgi:hypothetical protein